MEILLIGFLLGCLFTYMVLYLPSMRLNAEYQERLERRIKERSW